MITKKFFFIPLILIICSCTVLDNKAEEKVEPQADQTETTPILPSWNETDTRDRLITFVENSTDSTDASFLKIEDRIAVFDNDGTLWAEQPYYFQLAYAIDQAKKMLPDHPEWNDDNTMKVAAEGDVAGLLAEGERGLIKVVMSTHAGMSETEFANSVTAWADTATHPVTGKKYVEMIYQPMLELLEYLRESDYKTYIVSGGGVAFMRAALNDTYGIPAEQIIGSTIQREFVDGEIVRLPEIEFIDDKEGKPINIQRIIGKKPAIAFGNSDGDLAMLQYTASSTGSKLMGYVHHTDSIREYAYDRDAHIGKLDKGLDEAIEKNWIVVDMAKDWKTIYPNE
ncbi:MAG: phosphoserine phosphatase [Cryomorphaceae bacterium]|jgi:phosphoserine phosphatase